MESEWIPVTTEKEIKTYLETETYYYMPTKNYYADPFNLKIRKLAVSVISKNWTVVDIDAFVPYLAMNYFDNFVSQSHDPYLDINEVRLIAITCLVLAAKIREFSVNFYLEHIYEDFKREAIAEMANQVQDKIEWFMKPLTPFCFLDFYYPNFKIFGDFKRRCINKIIVQAQGETDFVDYKFSDIAFSSFLAAVHISYPGIDLRLIQKPDGLTRCDEKLVDLCKKKVIKIEKAGSGTAPTSSATVPILQGKSEEVAAAKTETESGQRRPGKEEAETSESDRKRQAKGKAVVVEPEKEEEEEEKKDDPLRHCPKKLMDFMLLWPIDDPFAVKEPIQESSMASNQPVIPESEEDDDEERHSFEFPNLPNRMESF